MRTTLTAALVLALCSTSTPAQDWPHWRGPRFDGSTEAKDLPTDFSREKGVKWSAALPGPGSGTPIVLGERVFLSSIDEEGGALLALCHDAKTGAERWVADAGSGYRPGGKGSKTVLHQRSNYASPSPVTDCEPPIGTIPAATLPSGEQIVTVALLGLVSTAIDVWLALTMCIAGVAAAIPRSAATSPIAASAMTQLTAMAGGSKARIDSERTIIRTPLTNRSVTGMIV